jgi:hypothetical protein
MGAMKTDDPASALNRKSKAQGWPFHFDAALRFERRELNALRDLWLARAADRTAPSRADLGARMLKPYLPNITISERIFVEHGKWRYRTRLSGSTIAETVGDHTGKYLEEQLPADSLPRWTAAYDAVLDGAIPLRLVSDFSVPCLNYLTGEIFIAPLADERGKLSLVIGCMYVRPRIVGSVN